MLRLERDAWSVVEGLRQATKMSTPTPSPPRVTVRVFVFIARRILHFLPSSVCIWRDVSALNYWYLSLRPEISLPFGLNINIHKIFRECAING